MKTSSEETGSAARYLSVGKVAELLDVSSRTVWRLVAEGVLPKPVVLGKQLRRWRLADVEARLGELARNR